MRISKWGDSLAIRLPKALVQELALQAGDHIDIVDATRDRLVVEKKDKRSVALARMRARRWTAPADYRFDREEANER